MQIQNERKETVYKYDLDCTDEEAETLKKLAIERFAKDEKGQLEYAVLSVLSEAIGCIEEEPKTKKVKGSKNGSKNISRK